MTIYDNCLTYFYDNMEFNVNQMIIVTHYVVIIDKIVYRGVRIR